jgi:hypothetical protein
MPYHQIFQAVRNPQTQHLEKSTTTIDYLKSSIYFYLENKPEDPQHYFFLGVSKHDGLPLFISLKSKQAFDTKAVQATINGILDNIMSRGIYKPPFNPINGFDCLLTHRGSLREIAVKALIEYTRDILQRPKPIIPYISKPLPKRWEEALQKLAAESNPNLQVISDDCLVDCFHHDSNYHTGELNKRFVQQQIKNIEESLLSAYRECQQSLPSHIDFAICSIEFLPRNPGFWSFSQALFYCSNRGFSAGIDTCLSNYSNSPESHCCKSEMFAESRGKVLVENFEINQTIEILDSDRRTVYAKLRTRELSYVMYRWTEFKWLPVLELQNGIHMQSRSCGVIDCLYPILGCIYAEINKLIAADPSVSDELIQTCHHFFTVINAFLKEAPTIMNSASINRIVEIASNIQHPLYALAVYGQQALAQIELAHICKALPEGELKTKTQILLVGLLEFYQQVNQDHSEGADEEAESLLTMLPDLIGTALKLTRLTIATNRYLQSKDSTEQQAYTACINTFEYQAEENDTLLACVKFARDLIIQKEVLVLAARVTQSKQAEIQSKGAEVVQHLNDLKQALDPSDSVGSAKLLEATQETQRFVANPSQANQKAYQAYVQNLQGEKAASSLWKKLLAAMMILAGVALMIGSGLMIAASQGITLPVAIPTAKLGYTLSTMGMGVLLAAGGGFLWAYDRQQKKDFTMQPHKGFDTPSLVEDALTPSSAAPKGI